MFVVIRWDSSHTVCLYSTKEYPCDTWLSSFLDDIYIQTVKFYPILNTSPPPNHISTGHVLGFVEMIVFDWLNPHPRITPNPQKSLEGLLKHPFVLPTKLAETLVLALTAFITIDLVENMLSAGEYSRLRQRSCTYRGL